MKAFVSIYIFLLSSYFSFAQTSFEGIIKWNILVVPPAGATTIIKLTDKEKLELNKSIAQLESQLKDPKMKAKFDKNPSLKTNMEVQLQEKKAIKDNEGVDSSKPQFFVTKMKEGNLSSTSEDGTTGSNYVGIFQKKTNATFYLNKDKKTYSKATENPEDTENVIVKVVPTTVTKTILNYTCEKYVVTYLKKGETVLMNIWVTKELAGIDKKWFYNLTMIGNGSCLKAFNQIEGTLLAMEIFEQGFIIKSEVTEINPVTILDADFIIPIDYKEVPLGE